MFRRFLFIPIASAALILAGCATVPEANHPRARQAFEWHPERASSGLLSIDIYLDEGELVVLRGGTEIGRSVVSAGREGHNTPAGNYSVLQKKVDHQSNLYGFFVDKATDAVIKRDASSRDTPPPGAFFAGADMPYFQRLSWAGVGLHAGHLPGYHASHGCIRLPFGFAEILFNETVIGTPVRILSSRPPPSVSPLASNP